MTAKSSWKTAGYITRRDRKANGPPKSQPWIWFTLEMLESPAWRSLSASAYRVLSRICLEHMMQGGLENGRLKVTHSDFSRFGVSRGRAISAAIQEIEAAGFAMRTYHGRRTCGQDKGAPAQFRLTWLPVFEPADATPPTDDWKRATAEQAAARPSRLNTLRGPHKNIEGTYIRGCREIG
jgi:hypothetical protein